MREANNIQRNGRRIGGLNAAGLLLMAGRHSMVDGVGLSTGVPSTVSRSEKLRRYVGTEYRSRYSCTWR